MSILHESDNLANLNGRPLKLLIGGFPCVPAGTKIKVRSGYKNIEDVVKGDFVLTHRNRYQMVTDTMTRKTNELYHIKFNGSETINITGNHPLYVLRNGSIDWIEASDLMVGDYVCCNINQNQNKGAYTNEDLWLMGRFLADGYRDKKRARVIISVGKDKTEEFERNIKNSGYTYYIIHKDRSAPEYVVTDKSFFEKCLMFKDGAINKFVPDLILDLENDQLEIFLKGYWSGDGHKRKNRKDTFMWSTISSELMLSVAMVVAKLYKKYPTVTRKREKQKMKQWNNGCISIARDSYNSQVALQTGRTFQKQIDDKVFIPIKKISKEDINCDVFNISVENDESYTVNNIVVHNCTKFSICQKAGERETLPYSGEGWELFYNYLLAKEKFRPDYFLAENNQSISPEIKAEVSKLLGVDYIPINSALVSAQTRKRVYWTNIPGVEQPEDRGILLRDILESGTADRGKSLCIARRYAGFSGSQAYLRRRYFGKSMGQAVFEGCTPEYQKELWKKDNRKEYEDQIGTIRQLTPEEVEKLQTMPVGYTSNIPQRWRYECLGNGWTAEVIIHILSHINISKDYPLKVLSMYDGIATGRYCLEKLGYKNITYKAYEIDKYAIQVAMKNYPDIVQCGDAYKLREDDWEY